jgi:hypothetical protein
MGCGHETKKLGRVAAVAIANDHRMRLGTLLVVGSAMVLMCMMDYWASCITGCENDTGHQDETLPSMCAGSWCFNQHTIVLV